LEISELVLDAGINWIDTAQSYGVGASEEALGAAAIGPLPDAVIAG